jgi:hypothetical protein
MDRTVMTATEQDEIVQRGGAAVRPVSYVVSVRPLWTAVAAWVGTAAIADGKSGADRRWDDAGAPSDVERLGGGIEDDPHDRGVACDTPHRIGPENRSPCRLAGDGTGRPSDAAPPVRLVTAAA